MNKKDLLHSKTLAILPSSLQKRKINTVVRNSYNSNEYCEKYRESPIIDFEENELRHFLDSMVSDSPEVLDIGCGSGYPIDRYLIQHGCHIDGIDVSENQIEKAKMNNKTGANYTKIDFMDYKINKEYDGIICLYTLFHIHRKLHFDALKRIYDGLKDGGIALITIYNNTNMRMKYHSDFCSQPMIWSAYNIDTYKQMLQKIGFKCLRICERKFPNEKSEHSWILLKKESQITDFEAIKLRHFLDSMVSDSPEVLDIGCGSGYPIDRYLIQHGCHIDGIDVSENQIEKAKMNNKTGANYTKIDFMDYKINKEYDGIICINSPHLKHKKSHICALKKMHDGLKNNGTILISVDVKKKFNLNSSEDIILWRGYNTKKYISTIKKLGFECLNINKKDNFVWILLKKYKL